MLHVFISRERYRAVLYFLEWKPYSRRTLIDLGVMWTVAVVMGVLGVLQGSQIIGETDDTVLSPANRNSNIGKSYVPSLLHCTLRIYHKRASDHYQSSPL